MSEPLRATPQRAAQLRKLLDTVEIDRGGGTFREPVRDQLVKNVSGELIPPYSVLMPVGVIVEGNRLIIEVDKFDGSYTGEFLFSWHFEIAINGTGVCQSGRVVRAAYQGGTGDGDYRALSNQWYLEPGAGSFQAFGEATTGNLICAILSGGGSDIPVCSIGGVTIPGLADSPIVDALDADYVVGIRDGCTVLIEVAECVVEPDPSGSPVSPEIPVSVPEPFEPQTVSNWPPESTEISTSFESVSAEPISKEEEQQEKPPE